MVPLLVSVIPLFIVNVAPDGIVSVIPIGTVKSFVGVTLVPQNVTQ
jgi:hypothetical protein